MALEDFILKRDIDFEYTYKLYFEKKKCKASFWHAQSVGVKPIETLWAVLKQKWTQFLPKRITELKEILVREWCSTSLELCKRPSISSLIKALAYLTQKQGGILSVKNCWVCTPQQINDFQKLNISFFMAQLLNLKAVSHTM